MALNYQLLPIPSDQLDAMKLASNEIYGEMIDKYGISNVENNFLIDLVILQEERDVIDAAGNTLHITAPLIRKVYSETESWFKRFTMAGINKLKDWTKSNNYLGIIPFILDHQESMEDKHGYIVGGSLRLITIDDKLHLICKAVLISPQSKYNWAMGLWREISPSIDERYKIREVSFVTVPAQQNNSSLNSGLKPLVNDTISEITNELDAKIELARGRAEDEELRNFMLAKEHLADAYVCNLINSGHLPSSKRTRTKTVLMQLSKGQELLVADFIKEVATISPLQNKPRTINLKGAIAMNTAQERFNEFKKAHADNYKSASELLDAFNVSEVELQAQLNLGNGVGQLTDPKTKYNEFLELLDKDEAIDEDIRKKFIEMCITKFGMKLADGNTGTIDSGGVAQPNNSNLSDGVALLTPDNAAQSDYIKTLQQGYEDIKNQLQIKSAEADNYKNKLTAAINSLGA